MAVTVTDILETIRDNADDMYISRVPEYTRNNLGQVGDAITSDKNIMNTFIDGLIDKIAFSNVKSKLFKNPLARLKQTNGRPYGSTIEEIFINPSTDMGYSKDGSLLLKNTKADGKVAYYGLNRQSCYPISLSIQDIQRGFRNEQEFMSMYEGVVNSMYSGDNIDEFVLAKDVFGKALDKGAMKVIESDIANPTALSKAISVTSKTFAFPNTVYAGYNLVNADKITDGEKPCITFCNTDRQCLIIRADAQTEIDYEVLASMFHMELAKLEAMTILVDTIPSEKYDVYAILCDVDAIQIRDTVYQVEDQKVGSALMWNYWLHHWQYLYLSMFGNAVAFAKAKTSTEG